jgi:protein TonB
VIRERLVRKARRTGANPATRRLAIFAGVSVALHFLLTAVVLVGPDLWPVTAPPKPPKSSDALPSVEFLMVQNEGFGKTTAPPSAKPAPDAPAQKPPAPKPDPQPPLPKPPPPPQDSAAEPAPAPPPPPDPAQQKPPEKAQEKPPQQQVTTEAVPSVAAQPAPKAEPGPEINLGGTDSLSSLIATGDRLIPPAIDAKFRNREPVYPSEAARRGQGGLVVVLVHVAPDGHAEAADIERSSGYPLLDNAARDAIITWQFRPAIENGVPVQSQIPITVDFKLH